MFKQQPRAKSQEVNYTNILHNLQRPNSPKGAVIGVLCHTIIFWPNDKEQHSLPTSISKAANVSTLLLLLAQDSVQSQSRVVPQDCRLFHWLSQSRGAWVALIDASSILTMQRCKSWRLPLFQNGRMYSSGKKKKKKEIDLNQSGKVISVSSTLETLLLEHFCFIYFSTVFGTLLIFLNDFYDTTMLCKVWMEYNLSY